MLPGRGDGRERFLQERHESRITTDGAPRERAAIQQGGATQALGILAAPRDLGSLVRVISRRFGVAGPEEGVSQSEQEVESHRVVGLITELHRLQRHLEQSRGFLECEALERVLCGGPRVVHRFGGVTGRGCGQEVVRDLRQVLGIALPDLLEKFAGASV